MSWDSKPARRRGQSVAHSRAMPSPLATTHHDHHHDALSGQAKSAHVADPFLRDFLAPSFDAAQYLNATLPPLQPSPLSSSSSSSSSPLSSRPAHVSNTSKPPVPLADLSAQTQATLSQLGAHTARLTAVLTHLTDDILRSGSRLAYQVELLRGETLGLTEALAEGLRDDMERFLPSGVQEATETEQQPAGGAKSQAAAPAAGASTTSTGGVAVSGEAAAANVLFDDAAKADATGSAAAATGGAEAAEAPAVPAAPAGPPDPPHIAQLRTLTLVRARLEQVIKTFGDAMEFVFPPSEVSLSSGFLSVSAPDMSSSTTAAAAASSPGGGGPLSSSAAATGAAGAPQGATPHHHGSTEEKGQAVLARLRDEVSALLYPDDRDADAVRGVEDAARRVAELKDLARVWRGTAEEKGRARFVDGLARMVEDRHRDLLREMEAAQLLLQEQKQIQEQQQQKMQMQMQRRGGLGQQQLSGAEPGMKKGAAGGGEGESSPSESGGGYGAAFLYSQLQKKLRSGL